MQEISAWFEQKLELMRKQVWCDREVRLKKIKISLDKQLFLTAFSFNFFFN